MKISVTIEETISEAFEVEAESLEEAIALAEEKYYKGEFVLEAPDVTKRMMMARNEEADAQTDWIEF